MSVQVAYFDVYVTGYKGRRRVTERLVRKLGALGALSGRSLFIAKPGRECGYWHGINPYDSSQISFDIVLRKDTYAPVTFKQWVDMCIASV